MRTRVQKISKYAPSIFQGRLEFSNRRGVSLTMERPSERLLLRALLGSLMFLACAYMYFVGASIFNVIVRKDALSQSAELGGAVARLEREYFALSQELGPEDGERLGLRPVSNTLYVRRPGNAAFAGETTEGTTGTLRSDEI